MATNFRGEIGDSPSFLGLAFHNGRQYEKVDRRVISAEVLSTLYKNLVNFGPLTPVYGDGLATTYSRNRRNAFDSWDSFYNGWQEPLNRFAPNSHGRRVWSFACTNLNVKVTRNKERAVHSQHPCSMDKMERPRCR